MERRGFLKACGAAVLVVFLRLTPELAPAPIQSGAVWYELEHDEPGFDIDGNLHRRFTYRTSDPRGRLMVLIRGTDSIPLDSLLVQRLAEYEARDLLGLV